MKIEQLVYDAHGFHGCAVLGQSAQWVLVFGDGALLKKNEVTDTIKSMYPLAYLMGCSTAGEIKNENVAGQDSIIITAIQFEKSRIAFKSVILSENENNSRKIGNSLTCGLEKENLKHIFVLSEGLNINGSKLVEGFRMNIGIDVPITGGLAGDGSRFKETLIVNDGYAKSNQIVLAAIYGDIKTSCASFGGWDMFGMERIVTRSKDNILYEMDEKPALDLYREYLGEKSSELPASGLLFPLSVRIKETNQTFVRTLLGINEKEKSLIFAGDVPENAYCRLMKANTNNLIDGARKAALTAKELMKTEKTDLAILISCVGRRLILKKRVDEQIGVVRGIVGKNTVITGFYSYGEIAPYFTYGACEFHNQTMTLSFLSEE